MSGRLLGPLRDLLVPPTCASCGVGVQASDAHRFCDACLAEFPPLPIAHRRLADVTQVLSCSAFDGLLSLLIQRLKYERELALARPLGELLVQKALAHDLEPDLVVPMPISRPRQVERGFDHAWLLSAAVAEALGAPRVAALHREHRPAQVGLPKAERRENLAQAFWVAPEAPSLTGRTVLLIDDVITTGATAEEAARSLREAGASSVDVLTLAVALQP